MRNRSIKTRILIIVILLLALAKIPALSQGTDLESSYMKKLYVGLSISPAQTSILNNGISDISQAKSTKRNAVFISIDGGYFFSKYFGLSSGIGYSSYLTDLALGTYNTTYTTTDTDQDIYERRISGAGIEEIQKIGMLSIPVMATLQIPFNPNFGLDIQTGLNFSVPVTKNYSSTGTFTYSGYYPVYKVLISDVPYEGFQSNVLNDTNGDLELNTFNPEFIVTGGMYLLMKNKIQISLGLFYNKLLSNISGYSETDTFTLSEYPDKLNTLMGGSTKTTTQALGIRVGFRYYIK